MSTHARVPAHEEVIYPDCDGEPMADNTLQYEWITTIKGGLDIVFRDDPHLFVAADLLWYPVEGSNTIRTAPDALVVFGRPKGYRGSYMQWREEGIAPQVVFEVTSPGNRAGKMREKSRFYERYGVEEYYRYDPDVGKLEGWLREGAKLKAIAAMRGWLSPRLQVRFDLEGDELRLEGPDGRRFLSFLETERRREEESHRADIERERANIERQRADIERQRAEAESQRAEHLAARLRALGIDPEAAQ